VQAWPRQVRRASSERDGGHDERDERVRPPQPEDGVSREARRVSASPVGRSNRYRLARADLDQLATLIGTLESGGE
jgi:hypothetical protein